MTNPESTKKNLLVDVVYLASKSKSLEDVTRRLSTAFDILFEEVMRMDKTGEVRCHFLNLVLYPRSFDINGHVGIYFIDGISNQKRSR